MRPIECVLNIPHVRSRISQVCAKSGSICKFRLWSVFGWFDFAFPIRALQTPENHICKIFDYHSMYRFRLPDVRCTLPPYMCDSSARAQPPRMKYSLNSQWFMMVSCKFFDIASYACVERWVRPGPELEWLFQFERNHLLASQFFIPRFTICLAVSSLATSMMPHIRSV